MERFYDCRELFDFIIIADQRGELQLDPLFVVAEICPRKRVYTILPCNADLEASENTLFWWT